MGEQQKNGFTLIELLIGIAVAAVLLSLAVPSFRDLLYDHRLSTQTNSFVASASLARSEAVRQARPVRLTSASGTSSWHNGWSAWIDLNGNDHLDSGEALDVVETLAGSSTLVADDNRSQIAFSPNGTANPPATLLLCDDRTGETGRRITVALSGRLTVESYNCP